MTNYLLDTNHLSPLVTIGHPLRQKVQQNLIDGHTFAIPAPVITEFLFGIGLLPRAEQNMMIWQELRDRFNYYGIDRDDAERAAQLRLELRRRGWQLAAIDSLVACVALRYDLTLLTVDKDFSAIPGLAQENWL